MNINVRDMNIKKMTCKNKNTKIVRFETFITPYECNKMDAERIYTYTFTIWIYAYKTAKNMEHTHFSPNQSLLAKNLA